jgi:hypothetical protein
MFSIYSHVRNRNRGPQAPGYDSDEQTPTPPPSLPAPKPVESTVKSLLGHVASLPTPNSTISKAKQKRNSPPLFIPSKPLPLPVAPARKEPPAIASEPSEADEEEEAIEAPAAEEILTSSQPRPGCWVLDALKREPSPIQPDQPAPTATASKRDQICHDHRAYLLSIKRSMRGRIIAHAPVGDRTKRSTRYISPFTLDELQELYNKSRISVDRVAPASPEIPSSSESVPPPPKKRQPRTPELKKQQQRPKSQSARRQSVRQARVQKPIARKSKGMFLF